MKAVTILGARPQFIKAAPVSQALQAAGIQQVMLHTGQHYDPGMSQVFFDELTLPEPAINLGVGSGSHAQQTAQMLVGIENFLSSEQPDWVIVFGDTNSTLAGALAAVKLHLRVAHIEAGLRSFNRQMPEEHNRVLTDHCSDLLFCPTRTALENLRGEGLSRGAVWVGDVMYDAILQYRSQAKRSTILARYGLLPQRYYLATLHRPVNTDDPRRLKHILAALDALEAPVILPLHPRTHTCILEHSLVDPGRLEATTGQHAAQAAPGLLLVPPASYLEMLQLEQQACAILTDSGGVQKEACCLAVPCVTLRSETEWPETLAGGWNQLIDANHPALAQLLDTALNTAPQTAAPEAYFGDGTASQKIAACLQSFPEM